MSQNQDQPQDQPQAPQPKRMTIAEYGDLSVQERTRIQIGALRTAGFKTQEELIEQITQYVHARNLDKAPVRMATLNRRFYKAAKAFGMQVTMLALSAPLKTYGREGNTILLTCDFDADLQTTFEEIIYEPDIEKKAAEVSDAFERFLGHAQ